MLGWLMNCWTVTEIVATADSGVSDVLVELPPRASAAAREAAVAGLLYTARTSVEGLPRPKEPAAIIVDD